MKTKILLLLVLVFPILMGAQLDNNSDINKDESSIVDSTLDLKDVIGTWHNGLGSTLVISKVDSTTGDITGHYRSPSGTKGEKFPLTGWVNHANQVTGKDNVMPIAFTVRWGKYGSITSWTGFYRVKDGTPTITTFWNLVRSNSDFSWDHLLTGSDIFVLATPQKK